MKCWVHARAAEKRLFEAVARCVRQSPYLLSFLFDPHAVRLSGSVDELLELEQARSLSSGDYLLVKLALDLWSGERIFGINELMELEPDVFKDVMHSFVVLAHNEVAP